MQDSTLMVRTCALAEMRHNVGDAFSIEHIYPTPMIEMDCYKKLLALPGVFLLTFDNCMFEKEYKHRQCLITNVPAFAQLSRDCDRTHVHAPIAAQRGPSMRTDEVSPFAEAFCEEYARLLHMVLTSPDADRSVHCVCDREQENNEQTMLFDQVGRLAEIHLASMLPAMSGQVPVIRLHGWEEGRYVVSHNEIFPRKRDRTP